MTISNNEYYKKRVVYSIKNMHKVNVQNDIVYKENDEWAYVMDVYKPNVNEKGRKLPAVILVHGEPNLKDAGKYISLAQLIAASGLIAITFNHRLLSNGATVPEVISDIEKLINYVIKNSDEFNIDKEKLAIWSVSAGVPFGLYAGIYNSPGYIKCNIAYYGFGDLKHLAECFNIEIPENIIKEYSPINLISKNSTNIAPLFIARAGLDRSIINESLDEFIITALKNNLSVDVYNHSLGQHSFDVLNDDNRTHEIITRTIEFLKRNLYLTPDIKPKNHISS